MSPNKPCLDHTSAAKHLRFIFIPRVATLGLSAQICNLSQLEVEMVQAATTPKGSDIPSQTSQTH